MPEIDMIQRGRAAREQVLREVMPALVQTFAGKVEEIAPTPDEIPQLWVKPDALLSLVQQLRERGFGMLVDLAGVDYYPHREPRFEVVYHFRQLPELGMIRIRVRCTEKDQVPSLSGIWPMATAAEREVYDQFGIKFKGHPNLTRILNPADWDGHPLRRDYPMRGPRAMINLEMPADENRYQGFVEAEPSKEEK